MGCLDGHGSGAGADVPDNTSRLYIKLSEGDGAHLGLRDQAALGPALREHVVRVAEAAETTRPARLVRAARLALQDHHIERREFHSLDISQLALCHALVGRANVFANIGPKIVESLSQQLASNARRIISFG